MSPKFGQVSYYVLLDIFQVTTGNQVGLLSWHDRNPHSTDILDLCMMSHRSCKRNLNDVYSAIKEASRLIKTRRGKVVITCYLFSEQKQNI